MSEEPNCYVLGDIDKVRDELAALEEKDPGTHARVLELRSMTHTRFAFGVLLVAQKYANIPAHETWKSLDLKDRICNLVSFFIIGQLLILSSLICNCNFWRSRRSCATPTAAESTARSGRSAKAAH